jgi:uncharacterized protein YfaS (alpha-2-macroglobulin family)
MVLGLLGAAVFAYATQQVKPVIISVLRMQGAPYFRDEHSVRNNFMVRLANKRAESQEYRVLATAGQEGFAATGIASHPVNLAPGEEVQEPLILTVPDTEFRGNFDVKVQVLGRGGAVESERMVPFLGPFREAP